MIAFKGIYINNYRIYTYPACFATPFNIAFFPNLNISPHTFPSLLPLFFPRFSSYPSHPSPYTFLTLSPLPFLFTPFSPPLLTSSSRTLFSPAILTSSYCLSPNPHLSPPLPIYTHPISLLWFSHLFPLCFSFPPCPLTHYAPSPTNKSSVNTYPPPSQTLIFIYADHIHFILYGIFGFELFYTSLNFF